MTRKKSILAPDWWDYTTIDIKILNDAANLSVNDLLNLSRPGFNINFYDTLESFYLAEALEYIQALKQATPSQPTGICGPIGPTEQLPLVAQIVNDLDISLKNAHFWGMDEWYVDGKEVPEERRTGPRIHSGLGGNDGGTGYRHGASSGCYRRI